MIGTGKIYGLESNSLVDERRDPIKATWAAARLSERDVRHLRRLEPCKLPPTTVVPAQYNKAIRRA